MDGRHPFETTKSVALVENITLVAIYVGESTQKPGVLDAGTK